MPDKQVRVTFQPHGRDVFVLPGTKLLEAAGRAGLTIDTPCGGQGTCGKCRVQITTRPAAPSSADKDFFSEVELQAGWRLACQTALADRTAVRIPESSLFADQHRILIEAQTAAAEEILPAVRKVYVELPAPTLADGSADLQRLERQVGPVKVDLAVLRELPGLLRKCNFKGTAVLADHRLIDFEPGDTSRQCCGAAFDIGTTTMVGSLLDLCTGEELAVASAINPQVSFGEDILSRIDYSKAAPQHAEKLRRAVVTAVVDMIEQMCSEAGVPRERIYEITFAGNTAMEHLLCGIDVAQLGEVPFAPAFERGLMLPAEELGIPIHPRAAAYVFPVIGGFVGGDIVAGMLATRLTAQEATAMMVDVGTNGEIVLAHDGRIWAASTAAGPAFEGARISCGMHASAGAIEKVVFAGDIRCGVIGNVQPRGLCGSGLIDLLAELLRAGLVLPDGRMLPPDELPASVPAALKRRVCLGDDGQTQFLIASGAKRRDKPVLLGQRDVRELQLAAGAVRAGIEILLSRAGLSSMELDLLLIAGGFGSFIRRSNAQRIGLLPAEIDHRRIHYVGNASLSGARWALLSTKARKEAELLARRTLHVGLSEDPDFQRTFVEAMIFPAVG